MQAYIGRISCRGVVVPFRLLWDSLIPAVDESSTTNSILKRLDRMKRLDAVVEVPGGHPPLGLLSKMTSLRKVDLSFKSINAAGASVLAKVIKANTTLTELDLSNTLIDDDGD